VRGEHWLLFLRFVTPTDAIVERKSSKTLLYLNLVDHVQTAFYADNAQLFPRFEPATDPHVLGVADPDCPSIAGPLYHSFGAQSSHPVSVGNTRQPVGGGRGAQPSCL